MPPKQLRCAVTGCQNEHKSLHLLPTCDPLKTQWLNFIFGGDSSLNLPKFVYVCANHFTAHCFVNAGQYGMGFAQKLMLKSGSVPTVRCQASFPEVISDSSSLPCTKISQTPEELSAKEDDKCKANTRIDIGGAFLPWRRIRDQKGFKSDSDMAFYLLQSVCGESLLHRKRGREFKPDSDGDWIPDGEDHQSLNEHEDLEASEIQCKIPVPCETDESSENGLKSEAQLTSVVQIKSEEHIDQDNCQDPAAPTEEPDIPQSFTSNTIKKEIKEEPKGQDNRFEATEPVLTSSQTFGQSFVETPNPETVKRARPGQLVPNKTQMSGLFRTCLQCGGPVLEHSTVSGNQKHLEWKCSKGHLTWLVQNSNPS